MSAWFVTSTGTEIGKTLVMCRMIHALRRAAVRVRAVKPVVTGFTPETAEASDTARILAALDRPFRGDEIAAVSPWRFSAPLSPDMAAAREGRRLDPDEIVAFLRGRASGDGVLLVEGVGGVMVPLNENATVLDVIAAAGFPAVLVAGSYLGTLSHTLCAAAALAGRGAPLAAVVVSESEYSPAPLAETADTLARLLAPAPVITVPRRTDGDGQCDAGARIISALGLKSAP